MDTMFWIKLAVTALAVVFLAWVAERGSPRLSGLLAGFPHGVAIILLFIGLEQGEAFMAEVARHTVAGLAANAALGWGWGAMLHALARHRGHRNTGMTGQEGARMRPAPVAGPVAWPARMPSLLAGSMAGLAAFFAVAAALAHLRLPLWAATLVTLAIILAAGLWMRRTEDAAIPRPVPLTPGLIAFRALAAALIVVVITGLAQAVGPAWAGLLAGFPVVTFPFLLVVHLAHGPDPVRAILRAYPQGLPALVAFALAVALLSPAAGLWHALLAGFAAALAYTWLRMKIAAHLPARWGKR